MNDDYDEDFDDLMEGWEDEDEDWQIEEDIEPKDHEAEDKHYNLEVEEGYGDKEAAHAKLKQQIFNIEELDI